MVHVAVDVVITEDGTAFIRRQSGSLQCKDYRTSCPFPNSETDGRSHSFAAVRTFLALGLPLVLPFISLLRFLSLLFISSVFILVYFPHSDGLLQQLAA
jgi:hypothetical protein